MGLVKHIREKPIFCILCFTLGLIVAGIIPSLSANNSTPQEVPDSFGDIKFGTVIKGLPNMDLIKRFSDGTASYLKSPEIKTYENVKIQTVVYFTRNEIFYAVCLKFNTIENFRSLEKTLTRKYGKRNEELSGNFQYTWFNRNALVLDFDVITSTCYVWIFDGKTFGIKKEKSLEKQLEEEEGTGNKNLKYLDKKPGRS